MTEQLTFFAFTFHGRFPSLVAQVVKNPPAMRKTWVRFLGWEVPLEKGMALGSSILAWRVPWTEEPDELQSMGSQRVEHDSDFHVHCSFINMNFFIQLLKAVLFCLLL